MHLSRLFVPGLALALSCGAFAQTGTTFCAATANSTGVPSTLTGSFGSGVGSDLHLEVTNGVPNEIGYMLAGNQATSGVPVSNGLLCLVGTSTSQLYRFNVAGTDMNSVGVFDSSGVLQNLVGTSLTGSGFDVPSVIPAGVPVSIMSGDTWHFQLWHRDTIAMTGSSNFSNGLSVTFSGPLQPISGMVLVPAGDFDMGSNAAAGLPYNGNVNSQPVHNVTIGQPFWMGEHEVTQAEYQALIGVNPSSFSGPNLPVEQVTWYDAQAYCAVLTIQESALGNVPAGYEYRLPTEAEWEYACRAGTTTEFNVGPDLLCGDARFSFSEHSGSDCSAYSTENVGSYAANAWGLHDMHGNVWEWCLDTYAGYSSVPSTDPFVTGGQYRTFRGGPWNLNSFACRSANRAFGGPGISYRGLGFRVVLSGILVP